jgi:hypothetical protein
MTSYAERCTAPFMAIRLYHAMDSLLWLRFMTGTIFGNLSSTTCGKETLKLSAAITVPAVSEIGGN